MELLDILQELLKFDSYTPKGKKGVHDWCADFLEERGFTVDSFTDGCDPSLVARFGEPTMYFNGHIDVVPPGVGWTRDTGQIEEGSIFGRGTLDMKGPGRKITRPVPGDLRQDLFRIAVQGQIPSQGGCLALWRTQAQIQPMHLAEIGPSAIEIDPGLALGVLGGIDHTGVIHDLKPQPGNTGPAG